MNVVVSENKYVIDVLAKVIVCGIPIRVIASVIMHVKLMNS